MDYTEELSLTKVTQGAFQFKSGKTLQESLFGIQYVRKAPFGGKTPKRIKVTLEVLEWTA